ncbi:hypothetical protein L1887_39102 [Cichorium endivia]|nr:hypothetical protein L1887_39102 [Cichorium endivia]
MIYASYHCQKENPSSSLRRSSRSIAVVEYPWSLASSVYVHRDFSSVTLKVSIWYFRFNREFSSSVLMLVADSGLKEECMYSFQREKQPYNVSVAAELSKLSGWRALQNPSYLEVSK